MSKKEPNLPDYQALEQPKTGPTTFKRKKKDDPEPEVTIPESTHKRTSRSERTYPCEYLDEKTGNACIFSTPSKSARREHHKAHRTTVVDFNKSDVIYLEVPKAKHSFWSEEIGGYVYAEKVDLPDDYRVLHGSKSTITKLHKSPHLVKEEVLTEFIELVLVRDGKPGKSKPKGAKK